MNTSTDPMNTRTGPDFSDVCGMAGARRALEVAAAGGHSVLFVGPAGCGATMLARRLPTILPDLTEAEAEVVTAMRRRAGLPAEPVGRPFRAPHHTISQAALTGVSRAALTGGAFGRPGEVDLARYGVLFLDEASEFRAGLPRALPDVLRAAAVRPCPCGWPSDRCACPPSARARHKRAVEHLARSYDLVVRLSPTPAAAEPGESSGTMRRRVVEARARRNPMASLDFSATELADTQSFTLTAADRVLRVARTVAALDRRGRRDAVTAPALREALYLTGA